MVTNILVELLPTLIISAITTYIASVLLIKIERMLGILCKDVHKPYEYSIPCIGGFPLYTGALIGLVLSYYLGVVDYKLINSTILVMTIGLIIGFIDDLYDLKSGWKILLGILPALPLILMGYYNPRPWIPFIGHARLHIIYPLMLLIASTVYLNGANMIDTHNGLLPMFALVVVSFAFVLKIVTTYVLKDIVLIFLLIVTLAVYLIFNKYPAKMLNGNTGSFLIGSILLLVLTILRVEFYMILASIPMFLNGFYYISSIKGFLQKEQVSRPSRVDEYGCIHPVKKLHPMTFIKLTLILGGKPLSEKELVKVLYFVYTSTALISFVICYILGYS